MEKLYIGIELGLTRIKAVVIDEAGKVSVATRATSGEGGAWAIAKLASCLYFGEQ